MCVLASRQEILELCGDHWQAAYKGEIERLHDQLSECRENSVKLKMIGKELARKYRWLRRIDDRRARTVLKELLKNFELSELINEWLGEGEA
jgi:vacuolar-type H+-ATPase subunit C/Vma6